MQSLLYAVGLGAGSIPMAAALNWVIKDGLGQLGGVLFASYLGTSQAFDSNPKKWRFVSSLSMDASTLMEVRMDQTMLEGCSDACVARDFACRRLILT